MHNKDVAHLLKETADCLELTGGNPFRARAFQNAARTLKTLETPITELIESGAITDIRGLGKNLAKDIEIILATGSFPLRDNLLAAIPPGLFDLLKIRGLGPKRVRRLWQELGMTSLDHLEHGLAAGEVAALSGFGPKSAEKILTNLEFVKRHQGQRRFAEVMLLMEPVLAEMRTLPAITRAEFTGDLRRNMDVLDRTEILVTGDDPAAIEQALQDRFFVLDPPPEKARWALGLPHAFPLWIHYAEPDEFGTAWWRLTGSEAYCTTFIQRHGEPTDHPDEPNLYQSKNISFTHPELRESGEAVSPAPYDLDALITTADLQGNLHNHSTYSDGAHTLQEMADHARALGFSYFGICDYSQSLRIANGMPVARVLAQHAEIAELNTAYATDGGPRFRIFSGIESDILLDGSLDYDDDILATFDVVVASIHTHFNMTETEATERLLRAIAHPATTILGHPTGRILLTRAGYPIDHEAVIAACAAHNVALELNASPYRLDVDWRWIYRAVEQGVLISINPDAHSMEELAHVRWGVAVARKGGLQPHNCLNAKSLDAFTNWLETRKR